MREFVSPQFCFGDVWTLVITVEAGGMDIGFSALGASAGERNNAGREFHSWRAKGVVKTPFQSGYIRKPFYQCLMIIEKSSIFPIHCSVEARTCFLTEYR